MNELLNTKEAAVYLGTTRSALCSAVNRGALNYVKRTLPPKGQRTRGQSRPQYVFSRAELDVYRSRHKRAGWTYSTATKVPKNGFFWQALVVGGEPYEAQKAYEQLKQRGILVRWHLPYKKVRPFGRPIPQECDLVIIFKDLLGHSEEGIVVDRVKNLQKMGRHVELVRSAHKKASLSIKLGQAGLLRPYTVQVAQAPKEIADEDSQVMPSHDQAVRVVKEILDQPKPDPEMARLVAEKATERGVDQMTPERAQALADFYGAMAKMMTAMTGAQIKTVLVTPHNSDIE